MVWYYRYYTSSSLGYIGFSQLTALPFDVNLSSHWVEFLNNY